MIAAALERQGARPKLGHIAGHRLPAPVENRHRDLRLVAHIVHYIGKGTNPARPVDVVEHRRLRLHLPGQRNGTLVMRLPVDEANHGKARRQR